MGANQHFLFEHLSTTTLQNYVSLFHPNQQCNVPPVSAQAQWQHFLFCQYPVESQIKEWYERRENDLPTEVDESNEQEIQGEDQE